jgi:hypothetical protein
MNKIVFSVYEDDCLYASYATLREAKETALFIRENIGQPVSICKEAMDETRSNISSIKIPF